MVFICIFCSSAAAFAYVDFYCFSGHKMFGPTGIGVLFGKMEHLSEMRPYQVGGGIVEKVTNVEKEFTSDPAKKMICACPCG